MAASKPGTYFASILFALTLFVALLVLVTLVIANPRLRPSLSVFTVAFATGTMVVLTMLFMRVLAAERMISRTVAETQKFSVHPCPDTHVLSDDQSKCNRDLTTTLTMTSDDSVTFANPVVYTSSANAVDLAKGSPSSWTVKDLRTECALKKNSGFLKHPHSQLAPYCPEP